MPRILIFFVFISLSGWAQSGSARLALSRMEKEKWDKAEEILQKAMAKDSAEAKYVWSVLFFNKSYPRYNIDSAHRYINLAIGDFKNLPEKERDRLKRLFTDSTFLQKQKDKTDSAAFELARQLNSESSFDYFLNEYVDAQQVAMATELRNAIAYAEALKINSYKSFDVFLKKYPTSRQAAEAKTKYDELIFNDRTRDGKLKSYESFVEEFPSSPFLPYVERQIFEIATANGSPEVFHQFMRQHPQSKWLARARAIAFHLDADPDETLLTDSLRKVEQLNKSYWVPFLKSGLYGFMDSKGDEKLPATYPDIQSDYLCGDIRTDYLVTSLGIVSRSGKVLLAGEVKDIKDLGGGFLSASSGNVLVVFHKSGFTIQVDGMKEVRVLSGRFLQVRNEAGWGIVSFSGRPLVPFAYDEIISFDDWIILLKNGKKVVVTADQVGRIADQVPLPRELVFDDVKRWAQDLCWVNNGALEGVINEALEFVIPLDRHVLSAASFGFLKKKGDMLFIEGIRELQNTPFDRVTVQGRWLLTEQKPARLQLFDIPSKKKVTSDADSVWFDKNIALVRWQDSVRAWISRDVYVDLTRNTKATLIGRDSAAWIVAEERNKKALYDGITGKRLFIADFDQIESPAPGYFMISKNNKKGLLDEKGKVLLPVEFDVIIQPEVGRLSLLKDKKFGLYNLNSRQLIKPTYERNLIQYNQKWFVASKDGAWGFIYPDSKPAGKFQFAEAQFWNDSSAWVKEAGQWKVMEIKTGKILVDHVKDFKYVTKHSGEYIAIIHQENTYGVISNRRGIVIPSSFSEIINLGDEEFPLYFTEKHVSEADISVVIYYDFEGKPLRKQAFEEDEYERIICEDN